MRFPYRVLERLKAPLGAPLGPFSLLPVLLVLLELPLLSPVPVGVGALLVPVLLPVPVGSVLLPLAEEFPLFDDPVIPPPFGPWEGQTKGAETNAVPPGEAVVH